MSNNEEDLFFDCVDWEAKVDACKAIITKRNSVIESLKEKSYEKIEKL